MIRLASLSLLMATLLVPISYAVGTNDALNGWSPSAPPMPAENIPVKQRAGKHREGEKSSPIQPVDKNNKSVQNKAERPSTQAQIQAELEKAQAVDKKGEGI